MSSMYWPTSAPRSLVPSRYVPRSMKPLRYEPGSVRGSRTRIVNRRELAGDILESVGDVVRVKEEPGHYAPVAYADDFGALPGGSPGVRIIDRREPACLVHETVRVPPE